MIFIITWLIGIVAGVATTLFNPSIRTFSAICSNLLFYQLTVTLTLANIIGFVGHVFKSDMVAEKIGWTKGSPFQKELGYAEFGYALAGFICIWFHQQFWLAVIILVSPLYILAGINHIKEMITKRNFHSHNTLPIISDILMPISWILLFLFSKS
jgi:hypothetical protein